MWFDGHAAASAYLHSLHSVAPDEVIDVAVTCDGTWSKRGFTATHRIVIMISWETGQVLDFEIKSKRCKACSVQREKMSEEDFQKWWEGHALKCEFNHHGSSPSMEVEGASEIFKRSECYSTVPLHLPARTLCDL